MHALRFTSVSDALKSIEAAKLQGCTVGSFHTMGALHGGHAACVRRAAAENNEVVVSIYPNRTQLFQSASYVHDIEKDVAMAVSSGATIVITPGDDEMYPAEYCTFLDQKPYYSRMDATVLPQLYRGMMSMSFRWVNVIRPNRSYWGMKDIGQTLLLERAVRDFMLPVEIVRVDCIRDSFDVPISSRLLGLDERYLIELGRLHKALLAGADLVKRGEAQAQSVREAMANRLASAGGLETFELRYLDVFRQYDFGVADASVSGTVILHAAVVGHGINHFDGIVVDVP